MRRWLAIAMAALVAVSIGGMAGVKAPTVQAGPAGFTFSVDCDIATAGIQAGPGNCTYASGTTSFAADVYITNNSGGAVSVAAFGVTLVATASPLTLVPTSPACVAPKLNCNPDFQGLAGSGWSCDPAVPDQDPDPDTAASLLSCINAVDPPSIGNGSTVQMLRVSYTSGDGLTDLTLKDVAVYDETVAEQASCNPLIDVPAICDSAQVLIGTILPTQTPTSTPTATFTPCSGGSCPTATSLAFVTVTPTPCPVGAANCPTATPGAQPTTSGEATLAPPPPPPPGGQPGGTSGGATGGRITLPDTGQSNDGGPGIPIALLAGASALGALGIASGLWFNARRRQEED